MSTTIHSITSKKIINFMDKAIRKMNESGNDFYEDIKRINDKTKEWYTAIFWFMTEFCVLGSYRSFRINILTTCSGQKEMEHFTEKNIRL
jgi:hypothetical protein